MIFGNWEVSKDKISYIAREIGEFQIPMAELNRIIVDRSGEIFYDWILKATELDWLSQDDLFDLNFAVVYAIGRFGMDFNYSIFDATLAEQFEKFDEEDEDEDY